MIMEFVQQKLRARMRARISTILRPRA